MLKYQQLADDLNERRLLAKSFAALEAQSRQDESWHIGEKLCLPHGILWPAAVRQNVAPTETGPKGTGKD